MKESNKRVALTLIFDTDWDQSELDLLVEHVGPDLQRLEKGLLYQPKGSHWKILEDD